MRGNSPGRPYVLLLQSSPVYVQGQGMGKHRGIHTGRSGGGSVRLPVAVERGMRDISCDRLRRSDGALWLPQSSPSSATPICVVGGAPRAFRGPLPVRRPLIGVAVPVTGRWSFECNLKTSNSILIILKYCRRIQPDQ